MHPPPSSMNPARMPLACEGSFGALPDLDSLWEDWVAKGPALRLDSDGPVTDAARWTVLAGLPAEEVWGTGTAQYRRSGPGVSALSLEGFLRSLGGPTESFTPLPDALRSAWFGGFTYELGVHRLGLACRRSSVPDYYFFRPSRLVVLDRVEKRWWRFEAGCSGGFPAPRTKHSFRAGPLRRMDTRESYEERVRRIQEYIAAGDFYQANLAQSFQADWEGSPAALYGDLRRMNPGPFMALFRGPGFTVASSSPERLVSARGTRLDARPIAGTRPRSDDIEENLRYRNDLVTSPKERAEHVMLVDLARNDLGRVSSYGSVRVSDFSRVESYATVQHLVSTVEGSLRPGVGVDEILDAVFPGGTITGCPKKRCVEVLSELETRPRGFYTGSLGYLAPGPVLDLNILIRTFTLKDGGPLEFFAGAGIVADSHPAREYEETLHKVQALAESLGTTLM